MDVPLYDAKNRLSALVDQAAGGMEIVITKRGKPVAKLVPVDPVFDRDKAQRAADGLRRLSQEVTLGDITIRELIDDGRS